MTYSSEKKEYKKPEIFLMKIQSEDIICSSNEEEIKYDDFFGGLADTPLGRFF